MTIFEYIKQSPKNKNKLVDYLNREFPELIALTPEKPFNRINIVTTIVKLPGVDENGKFSLISEIRYDLILCKSFEIDEPVSFKYLFSFTEKAPHVDDFVIKTINNWGLNATNDETKPFPNAGEKFEKVINQFFRILKLEEIFHEI